jgi:hypothetical protein
MTDPADFTDLDDDDEYSSDLSDAELTDFAPKFKRIDSLNVSFLQMSEMRIDDLVQMYVEERNQLATDRKGWKAREAKLKEHMSWISMALRDRADDIGVDSFKSQSGTAYRRVTEKFTVGSWTDLVGYIEQTGNYHVLQKRVSPNAVKEIREAEGELPPGISTMVEVDFAVRSPTARKAK